MGILWVALGGAAGSVARYLVGLWSVRAIGSAFPLGTLAVNVVGSFLAGAIADIAVSHEGFPESLRLAIVVGFIGGFTTYSAFNYETLHLLRSGAWTLAAANAAVTVLGCFAAGALGFAAARWWLA